VKKVVFITPDDARYGFRLAGVKQIISRTQDIEMTLIHQLSEEETGIVVIDERLASQIDPERLGELEKRWFGLLLILPAPERPAEGIEDYALEIIRRAIGYHVRLR
jgi:vacuolar-type H+-ATPase subunit F/Vma7